ncbi:MAG: hypothetical protein C0467_26010 [Planctomycetaceae bacterium]|nr:hypothetical protein [Planctomycetaceae bacterium]
MPTTRLFNVRKRLRANTAMISNPLFDSSVRRISRCPWLHRPIRAEWCHVVTYRGVKLKSERCNVATAQDEEKYDRAVEVIAANCGAGTKQLITSDRERFKGKKVRALAGTSPEYQRYVIGRAVSGNANPFQMISATLLVYDTVAFKEVTSRLHRAVGMLRTEAAVLERAVEQEKAPNRLLTLDLVAEQAERFHDLLTVVETVNGSSNKQSKSHKSDSELTELTDKLNAAAGLGLIAKNVRNVSFLQPTHRPTPEQKEEALRLTTEALRLATSARDAGRRAFGRLDDACRERPARKLMRRVITHDKVDGDAVAAAWLAERFLFASEPVEVLFGPRSRVWGAWRIRDCIVDVGNTHDPKHLFFDHKQPAFVNRHDSCATRLLWDYLVKIGRPVDHLKSLVNLVYAGDSTEERGWFKDEYAESNRIGFHKALKDAKAEYATDAGVYRVMRQWLNKYDKKMATRKG